jgi:1-acyl-sn-glycerol-3-phosphate acyltransferase
MSDNSIVVRRPTEQNGPYSPNQLLKQKLTANLVINPFHAIYSRFSHEGRENIVGPGPFVIVSNHLSYFDPPLLVTSTGEPLIFVAKKELLHIPIFHYVIEFFGSIGIDRGKPSKESIREVKKAIDAGWSIGIFIEGTRNKTPGVLGKPHIGPAYFAWSNKVPIIPVGLIGTNKRFGKAQARIGKLIQPSRDVNATTWEIMESLSALTGYGLPPRPEKGQREEQEVAEKA